MSDHRPSDQSDQAQPFQSRSERRPVEYYIDEKWDKCIDLTLRRVTYSSLAAGAVALVALSRLWSYQVLRNTEAGLNFAPFYVHLVAGGAGVRAATTAFGAGFGAGSAYGDCQREVRLQACLNTLLC